MLEPNFLDGHHAFFDIRNKRIMLNDLVCSWANAVIALWLLFLLFLEVAHASSVFMGYNGVQYDMAKDDVFKIDHQALRYRMIEPVFQNDDSTIVPSFRLGNETSFSKISAKNSPLSFLSDSKQDSFETSPSSYGLVSCGGCFFITWVLLCPCVQRKKKPKTKELSLRAEATSTSTSVSMNESSVSGSFSPGDSKSCATSLTKSLQTFQGGQHFTLAELSKATRKFSPTCKIGQGGFGAVYKGKLSDGTVVAIKRARKKVYDTRVSNEFQTEVEMLMKVDHLNLVKLIGYIEENEERILVVEYVPNGNLREHLDGAHGVVLDLGMRLDICIDVAHALTYLHMYAGKTIIHRDVKPSNILLNEKFRAKVADFGYSRMGPLEMGETHVSTQVKGTAGYLDPEYLRKFQLTEKSDVYSFGIVLLEIITGRKPIDEKREVKERITFKWAFRKFLDGKILEILDSRLEKSNAAYLVVERIAELAFQCAAPTKQDRPCMKKVAEALWDIRKNYQNLMQEERSQSLEKKPPTLASMERNSMPARSSQHLNITAEPGKKQLTGSQSCKAPLITEGS